MVILPLTGPGTEDFSCRRNGLCRRSVRKAGAGSWPIWSVCPIYFRIQCWYNNIRSIT